MAKPTSLGRTAHHVSRLSAPRATEYLAALEPREFVLILLALAKVGLSRRAAQIAVLATAERKLPVAAQKSMAELVEPADVIQALEKFEPTSPSKDAEARARILLWLAVHGRDAAAGKALDGYFDEPWMKAVASACVDAIEEAGEDRRVHLIRGAIRTGVAPELLARFATRHGDNFVICPRICLPFFVAAGDPVCDQAILRDLESASRDREGRAVELGRPLASAMAALRARAMHAKQCAGMSVYGAP